MHFISHPHLSIVANSSLEPLNIFFRERATTEIYTLSLHDALPISRSRSCRRRGLSTSGRGGPCGAGGAAARGRGSSKRDRKSTRLNSSHTVISYAVFCLKKKKPVMVMETRADLYGGCS